MSEPSTFSNESLLNALHETASRLRLERQSFEGRPTQARWELLVKEAASRGIFSASEFKRYFA